MFQVRTHLGNLLNAGDSVLGYDLSVANFNDENLDKYKGELPEIVLVRKIYPKEFTKRPKVERLAKTKEFKKKDADETELQQEMDFLVEDELEDEAYDEPQPEAALAPVEVEEQVEVVEE